MKANSLGVIESINDVPIECGKIEALFKDNPGLESLSIAGKVSEKGIQYIADILKKKILLGSLELHEIGIGIKEWQYFFDALKVNDQLQCLSLMNNNIRDEGAKILYKALQKNFTLHYISLECNNISEQLLSNINSYAETNARIANVLIEQSKQYNFEKIENVADLIKQSIDINENLSISLLSFCRKAQKYNIGREIEGLNLFLTKHYSNLYFAFNLICKDLTGSSFPKLPKEIMLNITKFIDEPVDLTGDSISEEEY